MKTKKANPFGLTLTEVFLIIGIQRRTGELLLESGNNIGTILFHQGRIIQAFSPYSREIGDLLVEEGLLTEAELIETLKIQKRNAHKPIGGLLMQMGRVTFDVIERLVHDKIRMSIKEFQAWNDVALTFTAKEVAPFDRIDLSVHEFLPSDVLNAAETFLSSAAPMKEQASSPASSQVP